MTRLTTLDLLNNVDKFPHAETNPQAFKAAKSQMYELHAEDAEGTYAVGWMIPLVVNALAELPPDLASTFTVDHEKRLVIAFKEATEAERTEKALAIAKYWREQNKFKVLKGWRNERWPVYARNGKELLLSIERSAVGLFGVNCYGVHLNAYVKTPEGYKFWIGRRAANKALWPGMLDNAAAGGLTTGEDPLECIIREADEEAALPEDLMRKNCTPGDALTYISVTENSNVENGLLYPECQWVYDVELPADVKPIPKDGEVEEFYLWDVEKVWDEMCQGNFKPNCAMVMVNFFIRYGIMSKETEPHLEEVKIRLHHPLPFPGPQRFFKEE